MHATALDQATVGLATRVRRRRAVLGWSRADLAARAGMSPGYVEYVEDDKGHPSGSVLRRLADALGVELAELVAPPVRQPADAAPAATLVTLDPDQCHTLLASVPVGRVAFIRDGRPVVLPVNFSVLDGEVFVQTSAQAQLVWLARRRAQVSFEADDIDETSHLGWSVLCHGPTRLLSDDQLDRLVSLHLRRPWPQGTRRAVVVISPESFTGRRLQRE